MELVNYAVNALPRKLIVVEPFKKLLSFYGT
jgi:hypothetical protein